MALDVEKRLEKVSKFNLCVRCLREHTGECYEPANNKYCQACWPNKVMHNSMLCPIRFKKVKAAEASATPVKSQPARKNDDEN